MSGWARRLRLFQGAGQLEHIIAQHVEVGLGARHAPGRVVKTAICAPVSRARSCGTFWFNCTSEMMTRMWSRRMVSMSACRCRATVPLRVA